MVFIEDQCIEDIEKPEKTQPNLGELEDMDPITPPVVPDDGGVQQGAEDEGVPTEDGQGEQPQLDPPVEPQVRRTSRDRHPSKKYSPHEYIMLIDGGDPEDYSKALADEHKGEWLKAM